MLKTMIPALALVLVTNVAHAQTTGSKAEVAHAGGVPGTVGAMQAATYGIATSAQDVALQQQGRSVAAEGAKPIAHSPVLTGYSAGTVGAGQAR